MFFRDGSTMLCACDSALITTSKKYIKTEAFKRNGLMVCEWITPTSTVQAGTVNRQNDYGEIITKKKRPINNININSTTSGVTYPVGTTFKIYGVR